MAVGDNETPWSPPPTTTGDWDYRGGEMNPGEAENLRKFTSRGQEGAQNFDAMSTSFTTLISSIRKAAQDPTVEKFFSRFDGLAKAMAALTGKNISGIGGQGQVTTTMTASVSEVSQYNRRSREDVGRHTVYAKAPADASFTPVQGSRGGRAGWNEGRFVAGYYAAQQVVAPAAAYLGRIEESALNSGRFAQSLTAFGTGSLTQAEETLAATYERMGGMYSGRGAAATADRLAMMEGLRSTGQGVTFGGANSMMQQIARMSQANPHLGPQHAIQTMTQGSMRTPSTLNMLYSYGFIRDRSQIEDRGQYLSAVERALTGGGSLTNRQLDSMLDPTSFINTNARRFGISQSELSTMSQEFKQRRGLFTSDAAQADLEATIAAGQTTEARGTGAARQYLRTKENIVQGLREVTQTQGGWFQQALKAILDIGPTVAAAVAASQFLGGGGAAGAGRAAGLLGRAAGFGGRLLRGGLVAGAGNIAGGVIQSGQANEGQSLVGRARDIAGTTAKWAGTGAAVGSFAGPAGTVVGAKIGGVIGLGHGIWNEVTGGGGEGDPAEFATGDSVGSLAQGRPGALSEQDAERILMERTHHGRDHVVGLKSHFKRALAAMFRDNPRLRLTSGFRSIERQRQLWEAKLREVGGDVSKARKWVAPPGKSRHNFGEAADIGPDSEYGWLAANASKYGLHIPLSHEPWHTEPKGSRSGKDMASMSIAHSAGGALEAFGLGGGGAGTGTAYVGGASSEASALAAFFGGGTFFGGMLGRFAASRGDEGSAVGGGGSSALRASDAPAGSMSMVDIARVARSAGFRGDEVAKAVAIAMAESRGNPAAVGDNTPQHLGKYAHLWQEGEQSTGLWQIHYRPGRDKGNPARDPMANLNPRTNARNAYAIYQQQGWGAWSVTDPSAGDNHYSNWMSQARSAVKAAGIGDPPEDVAGTGVNRSMSPLVVQGGGSRTVNMYVTSTGMDAAQLAKRVASYLEDEHQFELAGG